MSSEVKELFKFFLKILFLEILCDNHLVNGLTANFGGQSGQRLFSGTSDSDKETAGTGGLNDS
jgi:hypothetical protein